MNLNNTNNYLKIINNNLQIENDNLKLQIKKYKNDIVNINSIIKFNYR